MANACVEAQGGKIVQLVETEDDDVTDINEKIEEVVENELETTESEE